MDIKEIINNVSVDNLYNHLLKIEGIKHHISGLDKLNETAEYIKNQLESYGVETFEQEFEFEGVNNVFKNVGGFIQGKSNAEIIISSHYDTVDNTKGANDNASAVASMLEIARVLSSLDKLEYSVRFISFTLEELHPLRYNKTLNKLKELDLIDEHNRSKNYSIHKARKEFSKLFNKARKKTKNYYEASLKALELIKPKSTPEEFEYFKFSSEQFKNISDYSESIGKSGIVGSNLWVEKAIAENHKILGVINLETIGYTSKQKNSQKFPSPLFKIFPKYKTKLRKSVGDFINIVGDKNSIKLAKLFSKNCKNEDIKLPYVRVAVPLNFEKISKYLPDLLRSDHAPFWKHNIPALMITDSADFRYPYYHTQADTMEKLDYEFMEKVTKATVATVLNF
jgi:aminopeptidase-like protein